jgi:hypothetical protein
VLEELIGSGSFGKVHYCLRLVYTLFLSFVPFLVLYFLVYFLVYFQKTKKKSAIQGVKNRKGEEKKTAGEGNMAIYF